MSVNGVTPPTSNASDSRLTRLPGARTALILLLLINLLNYIDRYNLAAVAPNVSKELLAGDDRADPKMGSLPFAFLLTYTLLAPLFGWLGDRMSRWWLIAVGVILWSVASGASGLAGSFALLFLTRCFVGVGEAAYGPVAPALISDLYPVRVRGKVLAWFYAAIPVGSALGYALGGQVAEAPGLGWRWAFYLVLPPGILLGVLCFFMREPVRGQSEITVAPSPRPNRLKDCLILLRIPSYVFNTLGMTAMTFAVGGLAFWMPYYLVDEAHAQPWGPIDPRTVFGGLTALAGLLATLGGGMLGDRLRGRLPGSYFLVAGVPMLLGFPMILLLLATSFDSPLAWVYLFLAIVALFLNTGPSNTILANVVPASMRSSAFAINIFIIHAFGDVLSPLLIGLLRRWTGNLYAGFVLVSVAMIAGGILWIAGSRFLERDTALAPTRLDEQATPPTD